MVHDLLAVRDHPLAKSGSAYPGEAGHHLPAPGWHPTTLPSQVRQLLPCSSQAGCSLAPTEPERTYPGVLEYGVTTLLYGATLLHHVYIYQGFRPSTRLSSGLIHFILFSHIYLMLISYKPS